MLPELSPKQREFFYSDSFLNICDGAVRSGKTHVCLWRFIMHTQAAPPGDMMMLGRTRETVERNAISPLREMLGSRIRWNRGTGELRIGRRLVWVVGVNDAQAESKIRGSTLAGSYVNEMTVLNEEAFDQLYDRHSIAGAKMFGDTNPDSPYHWLNVKWLENSSLLPRDMRRVRFSLEDNPYLPPEYVARLRRSHKGLWEKRMVQGLWVVAEGAIYDFFDPDEHVVSNEDLPDHFERIHVGVDYGTTNPTVFLAIGVSNGVWYAISEDVHNPIEAGSQRTDAQHSWALKGFLRRLPRPASSIEVDPSAASFRKQLAVDGIGTREADNAVLDGIRTVAALMAEGRYKIHESCVTLIRETTTYAWDSKAQQRGEDKPLKRDDHSKDAERYALRGALRGGSTPALSSSDSMFGDL